MNSQSNNLDQCQRIQVTREVEGAEQLVRITVERHDSVLGWYTAGALSLPLCQLPLLEQALAGLSGEICADCSGVSCSRKIIPFPMLTEPAAKAAEA